MDYTPPLIVLCAVLTAMLILMVIWGKGHSTRALSHAFALADIFETASDAIYVRQRLGKQAHHPLDSIYIPGHGPYRIMWVIAKRASGYNDGELAELLQSVDAQNIMKIQPENDEAPDE